MRGRSEKPGRRGAVITGGRSPDKDIIVRYTALCSVCVAADSGLETALKAGISPDFIVGDMDSLADTSLLLRIPAERVLKADRDKDETDTELALDLLVRQGCDERIVLGGSGGRMDHLFALRILFDRENPPDLWVGDESLVVGIGEAFSSRGIRFKKGWGEALGSEADQACFSLFPCGKGPHRLVSSGLYWPLDDLAWDSGAYSLSNRLKGSVGELLAQEGSFLAVLPVRADPVFLR